MRRTWFRFTPILILSVLAAAAPAAVADTGKPVEQSIRMDAEETSYLGVHLFEETDRPEGGARIVSVLPGSPAEKAGLEKGDVVVAFRDVPIHGPAGLTKQIRASKPGDKVSLTVIREGKQEKVTVEIGEREERRIHIVLPDHEEDVLIPIPDTLGLRLEMEKAEQEMAEAGEAFGEAQREFKRLRVVPEIGTRFGRGLLYWSGKPRLGVEIVEATPELREFFGARRDAGVLVGKVLPGSAAERAGVKVGDLIVSVDGEEVSDYPDLVGALEAKDGKTVDLEVIRNGKLLHLKATIPDVEEEEPTGPRASVRAGFRPPVVVSHPHRC